MVLDFAIQNIFIVYCVCSVFLINPALFEQKIRKLAKSASKSTFLWRLFLLKLFAKSTVLVVDYNIVVGSKFRLFWRNTTNHKMLEGVNPVADALGEGDQPEAHSKHDGTCYARILSNSKLVWQYKEKLLKNFYNFFRNFRPWFNQPWYFQGSS